MTKPFQYDFSPYEPLPKNLRYLNHISDALKVKYEPMAKQENIEYIISSLPILASAFVNECRMQRGGKFFIPSVHFDILAIIQFFEKKEMRLTFSLIRKNEMEKISVSNILIGFWANYFLESEQTIEDYIRLHQICFPTEF